MGSDRVVTVLDDLSIGAIECRFTVLSASATP